MAGYSAHRFYTVWEISWVARDLLVSQVGFCSIEFLSNVAVVPTVYIQMQLRLYNPEHAHLH